MGGLIFGGAYLWREISVSKSIELALQLEVNLPFLLCFSFNLRAIFQVEASRGLYLEGRFNGGFFALPLKGAYIWRGLYMEGLFFGILRYVFRNSELSTQKGITWLTTNGRAARGSPTSTYINTLLNFRGYRKVV